MAPSVPFTWLRDKRHRRSALRSVQAAVRRGWLDTAATETRAALVAELAALLDAPDLSEREAVAVASALNAMEAVPDGAGSPKAP